MGKLFKRLMGVMVGVSVVILSGCSTWTNLKEEKVQERGGSVDKVKQQQCIKDQLEKKYGEAFELISIDSRTDVMNPGTILAICYPVQDKTIKFTARLDVETGELRDKYLCELVGRNEEPMITEYVKTLWEACKVYVYNDTGIVSPTETNREMRHKEFLKLYPGSWQKVIIYIQGPSSGSEIDQEKEIEKYKLLATWLADNEYFKTSVSIFYLMPKAYEIYDEVRDKEYYAAAYYRENKEESIYANIGVRVNADGTLDESDEDFKENFAVWIKE